MALDGFDFKADVQPKSVEHVATALLQDNTAPSAMNAGRYGDKSAAMPAAFTGNGNDLTIVDEKIARLTKQAEDSLSPEARARANREADLPWKAIREAGEYQPPKEIYAQKGDTYWSIAQILLASRGHARAGNQEINATVKELAALNGKTGNQVNSLKAGEVIKLRQ